MPRPSHPDVEALKFRDRAAWRRWLARNHAKASEIWIVFAKKGSGVPSVRYDEAVEEALCFGWIDGVVNRIDEVYYRQRFTPRRPGSNWASSNRERFARMVREGRMTAAGLAASPPPDDGSEATRKASRELAPAAVEKSIRSDARAWAVYRALPPSARRDYAVWITEAKREATRQKRLAEALEMLRAGKRLSEKWGLNK
jgi:uncharacterized protein YdeI (YjbR/CyaY-like superfamily)